MAKNVFRNLQFLVIVLILSSRIWAFPEPLLDSSKKENIQKSLDVVGQKKIQLKNEKLIEISSDENRPSFNLSEVVNHHLADAPLWNLKYNGYDLSITKRVVMMWLASVFLLLLLIPLGIKARLNPYKKPSRFGGFIEVLVTFIRENVGRATMGRHSSAYEPFLLTLFFFILSCNILGLFPPMGEVFQILGESFGFIHHTEAGAHGVPLLVKLWPGITATGDLGVTAGLAGLVFLVILISGFTYQGFFYIKNIVPSGVPLALGPLLWIIELTGLIIKPIALSIRLLANMTAGHIIILILMSFIFQFRNYFIVPISVSASAAIYLLELFVAFLQAYIFTFLTGLFISEAQHRH